MYISNIVWHFVGSTKLQVLSLPLSEIIFEVLYAIFSTSQLEIPIVEATHQYIAIIAMRSIDTSQRQFNDSDAAPDLS